MGGLKLRVIKIAQFDQLFLLFHSKSKWKKINK